MDATALEAMPVDEEALAAAAEAQFSPKYPAWLYRIDKQTGRRVLSPPKQPKSGQFADWASSDHADYGLLLLRFINDLQMYRQRDAGVFDTHREGETPFFSVEPTTQINKLCSMVGGIPPRLSWPFKTEAEKTAAQAMEDWAYHWLEMWGLIHARLGNGDLRWDVIFSLGIYGRVIARILPDKDDPDWPWKAELCDPATCFPVFGDKYGLLRMTRVYRETLGRVLDSLDPNGEQGIHRKLVKHYKGKANDQNEIDLQRDCTVREVWTRWDCYYEIDGVEVLKSRHEYGKVPFVLRLAPGEMGMTSTPELNGVPITAEDRRDSGYPGFSGVTTRQLDIARKGLSFFHGFKAVVRYEEMLNGLMLTIANLDAHPPQITESGYDTDPSPVDMRPGGHTKRRPGEKTTPVQTQARAQVLGPLINALRNAQQKAGMPDNVFGIVEGSNVTGFAENTLLAATKDRIQPYIDGAAAFYADCVELAAYLFHGFGHLYVEDAATGEYRVPKRTKNPYQAPVAGPMPPVFEMAQQGMGMPEIAGQVQGMAPGGMGGMPGMPPGPPHVDEAEVAISRETMELVGFRPKVALESWDWNAMTQRMNVAQLAVQGGIWSQWTARDKVGVEDPSLEGKWIDVEKAKAHPMVMPLQILQAVWETGNVNAFLALSSAFMGGMGGPGGAPGAPPNPADPTNGGSVRGVQTVQGDSQPSIDPGRGPGRPGGVDVSRQGSDVGP